MTKADDWELDPKNAEDKRFLENDAPGIKRDYGFQKQNLNAMLQYKFKEDVALTAQGGVAELDATLLSGLGGLRSQDFLYSYGQLRFRAGGFFSQIYTNKNDAGNSYTYSDGRDVVDFSSKTSIQFQFDNQISERQSITFGSDLNFTRPQTNGTIMGRNENTDDINEYGAYLQSQSKMTSKLNLTLALRSDFDNIFKKLQVSPRAGLVYKLQPSQSIRATYNYGFNSPTSNNLFLDLPSGTLFGQIPIRGRGHINGFRFQRNPFYTPLVGTDLVASSLNPSTLGVHQPVGLPLGAIYSNVYTGIAGLPTATIRDMFYNAGVDLSLVPDAAITALIAALAPGTTNVEGFAPGTLGLLDINSENVYEINDVTDIPKLKQIESQTFELGYKGLFKNKLAISVDAYYVKKKNFVANLMNVTPFVFVKNLAAQLQTGIAQGIQDNTELTAQLQALGLSPEITAAILTGAAAGSLPDENLPVAVVQPAENDRGQGYAPEMLLTFRNFGNLSFWGMDISMMYEATKALQMFANLSFVSDDFFDNEELDESGTELNIALNAPKLKVKGGFNYQATSRLDGGISGRFIQGHPILSGVLQGGLPAPYGDGTGGVEDYFLLDIDLGYDLNQFVQGLRLDVSIYNALDNKHREFVGAPRIGRMAVARFNYTF